MYLSLTEIQIQREEDINKNPISKGHEDIVLTPPEILYQVSIRFNSCFFLLTRSWFFIFTMHAGNAA